jgi:hypothetical protein
LSSQSAFGRFRSHYHPSIRFGYLGNPILSWIQLALSPSNMPLKIYML